MSKQSIKATINANIKQNGVQAITGQIMNSVLNGMVDNLAAEDEVVKLTSQALTPSTQEIVRQNIGAIGEEELEEVSGNLDDLDKQVNGYDDTTETEIPASVTDKYYNLTSATLGSSFSVSNPGTSAGVHAYKFAVVAGEKYKIVGKGKSAAVGLYAYTGNENIVLAVGKNVNRRDTPEVIDITEDGFLYVNLADYVDTDKVASLVTTHIDGIVDDIEKAKDDIETIDGKVTQLDIDVNGEEVEEKEFAELRSGRYYNTNSASIGSPYSSSTPNSGATYSCAKVAVVAGEKYEIRGLGGSSAVRAWVYTGNGNIVLRQALANKDSRTEPMLLDITEDGFLYYNTIYEDGDYLAKIANKIEGGYKNYVDEKVASIPNAVKGKTYILCGDSQVGQTGNFPTYLAEMLHSDVYMCGFGGMRYADTANASVAPSHNPFSSCGVADALTTGDFTAIENAIETYYPTNDRYRLALANMQSVYAKINATKGENVVLSIAYGGNDYGNSISLGTHGDGSRRTVIGAQEYAIETLLTKYPLMQIIIVGNPWVVTSYDETTKEILEDSDQAVRTIDGTSMHRYEYSDAYLANAHNNYHLKVFDMYRNSFRNRKSIWELSSDGVHPTLANGQRLLADLYFRIFYSL